MIESDNLLETTKEKSLDLIKELSTSKGFVASAVDIDNYKRIFSRDGVIAGLSVLDLGDEELIETFEKTLITLRNHQDKTGRIPSNVSLDEQKISYGTTVGRIDSTLWYIIGCLRYFKSNQNQKFLEDFKPSVEKAFDYLDCLELNGRGLIYVPPGGDWADEYVNEGYVLFDQLLRFIALQYAEEIFGDEKYSNSLELLRNLILINYFPKAENIDNPFVYQKKLFEKMLSNYQTPLPIASFSAFGAHYYTDLFAISLLFQTDLLNDSEKENIQQYLSQQNQKNFPIYPAFDPVINETHPSWNNLINNYIFRFKNEPHQYHNGGLWPVVYGFYLNSKEKIKEEDVIKFAEVLKRDDYIFPEFYHGENYEAMGTEKLGFSAAGFLLAYKKLKTDKKII